MIAFWSIKQMVIFSMFLFQKQQLIWFDTETRKNKIHRMRYSNGDSNVIIFWTVRSRKKSFPLKHTIKTQICIEQRAYATVSLPNEIQNQLRMSNTKAQRIGKWNTFAFYKANEQRKENTSEKRTVPRVKRRPLQHVAYTTVCVDGDTVWSPHVNVHVLGADACVCVGSVGL